MIRTVTIIVLPFLLILSLPANILAGPVPDTGQTKCYDGEGTEITCPQPGESFYGQDGNYTINPPSYTKLDASGDDLPDEATEWTMVRDNVTGLIWEVKTDDGGIHDKDDKYTWCDSNPDTNGGGVGSCGSGTDTEDFINALNSENYGGSSDWRLPTREELRTIVDYGHYNPTIDIAYFPNMLSIYSWSSTSLANLTNYGWYVYFLHGNDGNHHKPAIYHARAVRGGQAASVDPFVNNSDGTVTDTDTGLMWQQAAAPDVMGWQDALSYCENLVLAGHGDWRLPNIKELASLADLGRYNPAIDTGHFPDTVYTPSSYYWTSTTYAGTTTDAWFMNYEYGSDTFRSKSGSYYVRAVRGGQSGSFDYLAILRGKVVTRDDLGNISGPLLGASVEVGGGESAITDESGDFIFQGLSPGSVSLTVTKEGYYPATTEFTIQVGDKAQKTIYVTAQPVQTAKPTAFEFNSPQGLHFISGMPGELGFETAVAWNGLPGTVRFLAGGQWHNAISQDMGNGLARAAISIPIPTALSSISEVTIEATNGEGHTSISGTGVFFYPAPELLSLISDTAPSWSLTGKTYSSDTEISIPLWSVDASEVLSSDASLGYHQSIALDTVSGTIAIGIGGFAETSTTLEFAGVENLSGARGDLTGTLTYFLRGETPPQVQGNIELAGTLKSGVGAPAVYVLKLFPPAVPVVDTLLAVPVVKDILKALKLRLFLIGGLGINGTWAEDQNCWFGTETIGGSFTLGAEIQALIGKWGAELGVYAGGTGTPDFGLCPEFSFNGVTMRGYMGVFANMMLWSFSQEFGYEMAFGEGSSAIASSPKLRMTSLPGPSAGWQPIGASLQKWGIPNRLFSEKSTRVMSIQPLGETSAGDEQKLLENVVGLANPSVVADGNQTIIPFALHDTDKPWYSATDIAQVIIPQDSSATIERITDDLDAEFSPQLIEIDSETSLAAWNRVSGDISQIENPEEILPHMEIVAAHYNRSSGDWGQIFSLTDNGVSDRDPLPVSFGDDQGVLWVQNQGEINSGDSLADDNLLYSAWNGSVWTAPIVLWAEQKPILDATFVADGDGQGHIVFTVDEDGDADTLEDHELYHVRTMDGVWQSATRVTDNSIEDAIPSLTTPEGTPMCVWRQEESLVYAIVGDWNPKTVYVQYTPANASPDLTGITLPGGAAIAYTVQGPHGIDIYAAFYDKLLDQWSLPRQLTHDEHAESALALDFDGTELVVAYLKTITERTAKDVEIDSQTYRIENVPQPARTDLYVLKHRLGYDLAVSTEGTSFEPENPAPGASVTILAILENHGDLPVETVTTHFYLGDPDNGGILIDEVITTESLVPGVSQAIQTSWSIPEEPATQSITIVVDPALAIDDRDRSNNSIHVSVCKPDIAIVQGVSNPVGPSKRIIAVSVANQGTVPVTNIPVIVIREGSPDQILHQALIDTLLVNATEDVTFEWDTIGEETEHGYLLLSAVANADRAIGEFTYTNNARPIQVKGAFPGQVFNPTIPDESTDVSLKPLLDWDDVPDATSYDLYLWNAGETIPDVPIVSNLPDSQYLFAGELDALSEYQWKIVAVNSSGVSQGPEFIFTTKDILMGDINDDGSVDLLDAVLSLHMATGLNIDQSVYRAADVDNDGRICLPEALYVLQKLTNTQEQRFIRSSMAYDDTPVYEETDLDTMINGFGDFTFDFYRKVIEDESAQSKNIFFSTYSIENALAMTWAGARNNTAVEMADALHLALPAETFHPTLNALNVDINSRDDQIPSSGDAFQMNVVNAIWSRIGYPFLPTFLDIIAQNYNAGIRTLDFVGEPDVSRQIINQWVEDQTNEKIKDLLPENSISASTALVLTNAIYFKASWFSKFEVSATIPGDFTRLDGSIVTPQMMHQTMDARIYQGDSYDALEMPYVSPRFEEWQYPEELSMLIIVPHEGEFAATEGSLNHSAIDAIVASLLMKEVDLSMPKFEFEFKVACKEIMAKLGMIDAFVASSADFSGMVSPADSKPWIDQIYHKAFVAIDEEGTEAAAATAVVMTDSAMPEPVILSIDKPFIFLIRDDITGLILFMGRVLDPTV